jgi:hypothetical protein
MGLARSTVAFLRAQGHDAVHLRDQGLQRLEDDEIAEKAREESRVILTHDLDFGRRGAVEGRAFFYSFRYSLRAGIGIDAAGQMGGVALRVGRRARAQAGAR